jgi:HlyD family secretion protein
MMMKNIWRFVGIIGTLGVILTLWGCSGGGQPTATSGTNPADSVPPVRASGSVIAEGKVLPVKNAALSFTVGGVVDEVLVKEGDQVQAGQPIIRLKGREKMQSAVSTAELELKNAQQALKDLNDTADVQRSQALLTLAQAQKELDKAQDRVESKDYTRGDQEQIDTARANYIIAQDAVKKALEIYDRVDDRPEDDPVRAEAFSHYAATRQTRDTALANLNYLVDKPDDLDVAEVNAKLAVAKANVAEAQRKLNLMQNGPDADQLALVQERIKNAQDGLSAAKTNLDDLELKAPFPGTVSSLDIDTGEFASPGIAVAQLADFSSWIVDTTDLTELNIARITEGQPAMVNFDALPDLGLIGRVSKIKSLGENKQGDIVYTVELNLEKGDPRLRWNMTASVTFLEKDSAQ